MTIMEVKRMKIKNIGSFFRYIVAASGMMIGALIIGLAAGKQIPPDGDVEHSIILVYGILILGFGILMSALTRIDEHDEQIKELQKKVMGNEDDDRGSESPGKED